MAARAAAGLFARHQRHGAGSIAAARCGLGPAGYLPGGDDVNGPDGEGVRLLPDQQPHGRRISTNEGYLEPVRGRANLEIGGAALVDPS